MNLLPGVPVSGIMTTMELIRPSGAVMALAVVSCAIGHTHIVDFTWAAKLEPVPATGR